MIIVETEALVNYCCRIEGEDEENILTYAKINGCSLTTAAKELYDMGEIELYNDSYETDFSTENIFKAELEEDE